MIKFLHGLVVSADHPITVLNPDRYFRIFDTKVESNKLYVRGENTMWFHFAMIKREDILQSDINI